MVILVSHPPLVSCYPVVGGSRLHHPIRYVVPLVVSLPPRTVSPRSPSLSVASICCLYKGLCYAFANPPPQSPAVGARCLGQQHARCRHAAAHVVTAISCGEAAPD